MKNKIKNIPLLTACFTASMLVGCGSGSDSSASDTIKTVDAHLASETEAITTEYVNHTLSSSMKEATAGVDTHFTHSGTTLVHKDGTHGDKQTDIDRVILSRANNVSTGDLLAIAYDGIFLATLPTGTVPVLYMDIDNNPATGAVINGIGVDAMVIEAGTSDATHTKPDAAVYYYLFGQWEPRGNTIAHFSHIETGLVSKVVLVPDNDVIAPEVLTFTNATGLKGVLALQSFTNGNPNTVSSTSDMTSAFTFSMPQ